MRGLYIHIPFCARKCPYCDFNSYAGMLDIADSYVNRLLAEAETYGNQQISTVYIGGGTPSLLPVQLMEKLTDGIFKKFSISENAEVTVEVNPGTVDAEKLKIYGEIGINRLSVGVQSFDDEMLRILGRIHSSEQAQKVIETAFDVGFSNVSADLMFSYRGQTEKSWISDLESVNKLQIPHVSCYGLKIEERTQFYVDGMENLDEDTDRKLQRMTVEKLKEFGFDRYEISNYAKPGFESRHNLIYWHCGEYIGLGAGAHSYFEGKRYNNILSPERYITTEKVAKNIITLTEDDRITEKFIMGMRLAEGVEEKFAADKAAVEKYIGLGYIKRSGNKICFTDKGFDVSNYILSDII